MKRSGVLTSIFAFTLFSLVACGGDDDDDVTPGFDAREGGEVDAGPGDVDAAEEPPIDAAPGIDAIDIDAGPGLPIGAACDFGADCEGDFCIGAIQGFPDGYCSSLGCDLEAADTSCLPFGGDGLCLDIGEKGAPQGACFDTCDPEANDCRDEYECVLLVGGSAVCLPAPVCGNGDVERGEECEPPGTDTCDDNCQGTGTQVVGTACTDPAECAGDYCASPEEGFPAGYCTQLDCDLGAAATSCLAAGGDGVCLDVGTDEDPFGICFDTCNPEASDCREAYECVTIASGASVCLTAPVCGNGELERGEECEPPGTDTCTADCQGTGTSPIGGACETPGDCAGDECIPEEEGFPGGYCLEVDCDLGDPVDSCAAFGGSGVCLDVGDEGSPLGVCYGSCDPAGDDCRDGYDCVTITTGDSICLPSPVCGNGDLERGEECEPPGTDTCNADCTGTGTAPIGAACATPADCAGNECIPDEVGFPDGYCSHNGCDLESPDTSCAAQGGDGVCLDVGPDGDPQGACYDTCDPAGDDCRDGYECVTITTGDSICLPAPVCGNGDVERGEECEPPSTDTCTADCQGVGTAPIGAACTSPADCAGNECIPATDGFPGGYCLQVDCDLEDPTGSCAPFGGTGICLDVGAEGSPLGVCYGGCDPEGTDCREDYECVTISTGDSICLPAPVCGNGDLERGEECEPPGTATCNPDCTGMGTLAIGAACTSPAECGGDTCITEEEGFPDGYCSDLGCDLSNPGSSCIGIGVGGDGYCLESTAGTGFCVDRCGGGGGMCRDGYGCFHIAPGVNICFPD